MKKAILNLGLLSMMMMLTSFTSVPDILERNLTLDHTYHRGGGLSIPPAKKLDLSQNFNQLNLKSEINIIPNSLHRSTKKMD